MATHRKRIARTGDFVIQVTVAGVYFPDVGDVSGGAKFNALDLLVERRFLYRRIIGIGNAHVFHAGVEQRAGQFYLAIEDFNFGAELQRAIALRGQAVVRGRDDQVLDRRVVRSAIG
jgi:hypothetical protein